MPGLSDMIERKKTAAAAREGMAMSILDKPLISQPPQRRRRWLFFILIPLIILLVLLVAFTGPASDVAFLQHFFAAPQHFTYSGHSDYVSSVAWSPDGKRIASGSG